MSHIDRIVNLNYIDLHQLTKYVIETDTEIQEVLQYKNFSQTAVLKLAAQIISDIAEGDTTEKYMLKRRISKMKMHVFQNYKKKATLEPNLPEVLAKAVRQLWIGKDGIFDVKAFSMSMRKRFETGTFKSDVITPWRDPQPFYWVIMNAVQLELADYIHYSLMLYYQASPTKQPFWAQDVEQAFQDNGADFYELLNRLDAIKGYVQLQRGEIES